MTEECRVDSKIKILLIIHQKGFNKIVGDDVLGIPREYLQISNSDVAERLHLPSPPLCKGRWHGVSRDGGVFG